MSKQDETSLEQMVDRVTLAGVLDMLTEIATLKAEHIASNWQDAALAREWDRAAKKILKAAEALPRVPGIREG